MAQLIAGGGGYAATVGGTVRIFGSNDADVISLADMAGKISFDGSFNRGGDFIVLPNSAKDYSIIRAGSSVTLSDVDSTITIPVGSKGSTLQFADGELILKYDGQVLLGNQVVTTASATVSAPLSPKTVLPSASNATGTLVMAPDEPVLIGGNVKIFGTNGGDTVTIADVSGNIAFDGSFNRGSDTVVLGKFAENYSAARPSASNVAIWDNDTKLTIPLGTKGLQISFPNETRNLIYAEGSAHLGNQSLSSGAEALKAYEYNLSYREVKNAFVGTLPYGNTTFGPLPDAIDVNGDGYKDLVFLFQNNKNLWNRGQVDADGPAESQIRIFINNSGNGFSDKTSEFISQNILDGQANKSTVYDINGDGRLDIIYPTSREDGRDLSNPYHATTRFKIFISSDNGKYEIIELGQKDWYNDAQVFFYKGKLTFAASGYRPETYTRPQEFFEFSDGAIRSSEMTIYEKGYETNGFLLHALSWGFHFYDRDNGSMNVNTLFNGTSKNLESGALVRGFNIYKLNENGDWIFSAEFYDIDSGLVGKYIKTVDYLGWNNQYSKFDVFELGEGMFGGVGVFGATASIKIFPDSKPVFISTHFNTVFFSNDINSLSLVKEGDQRTYGKIITIDYNGYAVNSYELKIDGFDPYNLSSEIMDVFDFNKDGYEDIILYTWDKSALNSVFINKKDGTFEALNIPSLSKDMRYDSIYADFNNDGTLDIVSIIADGQWSSVQTDMSGYYYYTSHSSIG